MRYLIRRFTLVLTALLLLLTPNAVWADSIKDALDAANLDYVKTQQQIDRDLMVAFDSQLKIFSQAGDLETVEALTIQRKAFVTSRELPTATSMQAAMLIYQDSTAANTLHLKSGFQTAISDYTKAQDLDDALLVKRQMNQRFPAAGGNVIDGQATSQSDDPVLIALLGAKKDFAATIRQAHMELLAVIEKRANDAADKGDLDGFKRYRALQTVVLKEMQVPGDFKDTLVQNASAKFLRTAQAAFGRLKLAYQTAVSDYTKARKIEQAEALKAEMDDGGWFEKYSNTQPAGNLQRACPSIAGTWKEAPGVLVTIVQNGDGFVAQCSYTRPDVGQIRWEMKGTISADGKISGTLQHTMAPANWQKTQHRDGQLSGDGKTITGTAKWDNGGASFTWTRN